MDASWSQVGFITQKGHIQTFMNILGGSYGNNIYADVLEYDAQAIQWTKVGELADARTGHAVSLVHKETTEYCTPSL